LLLSPNPADLLGSLGTMAKVSEQASAIYRQASVDRIIAEALTDQARVAETERQRLASAAQAAYDEAKAAADAAQARLTEQQAASEQLYAQLAELKGTTSDLEQRYLEGLTAEQENAPQPPPPGPVPPPNPTPPPPSTSAVTGAVAFALAQVGDRYQFAGSGPDAWDCSGLTKAAYASVGVYIGAHVVSSQYYTMANQGRLVPIGSMVAGDLIFYADGGYPGGGFYHMAMYVGNGQMVEAAREGVPVRVTAVRYYDVLPYAGRPTP
ncbi:MAG: NlpC/P60 family protein, partial [Rhodoglobus sp.]